MEALKKHAGTFLALGICASIGLWLLVGRVPTNAKPFLVIIIIGMLVIEIGAEAEIEAEANNEAKAEEEAEASNTDALE